MRSRWSLGRCFWFGRLRFSDNGYGPDQNLVVGINPMRINDVLVLLPKLRPKARILQDVTRDRRKRIPLLDDMNFKIVRIGRILIGTDMPIRPYG